MQQTKQTADNLAEKLHDFNPNLDVRVKPGRNEVVGTIDKLEMNGEQLKALAEIAGAGLVKFGRTGAKIRMEITSII